MSLPLVFALQPQNATGLSIPTSLTPLIYFPLLAHLGPHSDTPPKNDP